MADRVMVMARNPGRIVSELKVDLPWPRRHMDHRFQQLREQLMEMFTATTKTADEILQSSRANRPLGFGFDGPFPTKKDDDVKKTPTENELTVEKTGDEISPEDLKYLQKHEMGRRDFLMDTLALGGLAATFGLTASASAWANIQPPDDEILRIGYLPITDATVLLVAHAKGFFEEEGIVPKGQR